MGTNLKAEVRPQSGGDWIIGYWTFYTVKIPSYITTTFELTFENRFKGNILEK